MKVAEEHWVTINGVHVLIGGNGRVKKGPKSMIGMTKEGVAKKTTNPKSRPNKKKHLGRKSAYQKELEKELGYSESKAKQTDKNDRDYAKLSPAQRAAYSYYYSEYAKTHKRFDSTRANTYAIKMSKGKKATNVIQAHEDAKKLLKSKTLKGSSKKSSTTKKSTKLEGATTGKFHEVSDSKKKVTFYNKNNYWDALSNAGLNGAFTSIGDTSTKTSKSNRSNYLRSLGSATTRLKSATNKRGKK